MQSSDKCIENFLTDSKSRRTHEICLSVFSDLIHVTYRVVLPNKGQLLGCLYRSSDVLRDEGLT